MSDGSEVSMAGKHSKWLAAALLAMCLTEGASASAEQQATLNRLDDAHIELQRIGTEPISAWLSADTVLDAEDRLVAQNSRDARVTIASPAAHRQYVILKRADGTTSVLGERVLPLGQASNFRDIGGYVTRDGRSVRWGRGFRSGAMPLLTPADIATIRELGVDSVVDLRSIDERELAPDHIDDETRALFLSNDYRMETLMAGFMAGGGENIYRGMEVTLAPQYRALYRRLMAQDGAVIFHCSAGQDRTGVATALLYDMLGVDRETILADYHLSTELRRPRWEYPEIDPAKFPGNKMAQHLAKAGQRATAAPLFTASGQSHLAQFFAYVDATYGGSEGYMREVLGFTDADLAKLREAMLE